MFFFRFIDMISLVLFIFGIQKCLTQSGIIDTNEVYPENTPATIVLTSKPSTSRPATTKSTTPKQIITSTQVPLTTAAQGTFLGRLSDVLDLNFINSVVYM